MLNATRIHALKKVDKLTWSMKFSFDFFFFLGSFMGMISLVNFEFELCKKF